MTQAASAGARSKGVYLQRVEEHAGASRRCRHAVRVRWPSSMVGPLIYGFSEDASGGGEGASPTSPKTNDKLVIQRRRLRRQARWMSNGVKATGSDPVAARCCWRRSLGLMQVARFDALARRAGGARREEGAAAARRRSAAA
jgi:hypothetical protein